MSGYNNFLPDLTLPFLAVQLLPGKTTTPYRGFCQQSATKTK